MESWGTIVICVDCYCEGACEGGCEAESEEREGFAQEVGQEVEGWEEEEGGIGDAREGAEG